MSKSKEVKPFQYTDSPDGEDILPKLWLLLKPAALTAFAMSTVDVMLYSYPKGYMQTLGRYVHFGAPILGATALFVVTHNLAGNIRKTNDEINWFLGGAAAGSIFGVWKKNPAAGFSIAALVGTMAAGQKHCLLNGYKIMPETTPIVGGIRIARQDWTLTKHRPGNWTTGTD